MPVALGEHFLYNVYMAERDPAVLEHIREAVDSSHLSEPEIARACDWSEIRLHRILIGKTRLLARDVETLARILGTTAASLYASDKCSAARSAS